MVTSLHRHQRQAHAAQVFTKRRMQSSLHLQKVLLRLHIPARQLFAVAEIIACLCSALSKGSLELCYPRSELRHKRLALFLSLHIAGRSICFAREGVVKGNLDRHQRRSSLFILLRQVDELRLHRLPSLHTCQRTVAHLPPAWTPESFPALQIQSKGEAQKQSRTSRTSISDVHTVTHLFSPHLTSGFGHVVVRPKGGGGGGGGRGGGGGE